MVIGTRGIILLFYAYEIFYFCVIGLYYFLSFFRTIVFFPSAARTRVRSYYVFIITTFGGEKRKTKIQNVERWAGGNYFQI